MAEHVGIRTLQNSNLASASNQSKNTPGFQDLNTNDIVQKVQINPQDLTHEEVMQLQHTFGNRVVMKFFSGINHSMPAEQKEPIQRSKVIQREIIQGDQNNSNNDPKNLQGPVEFDKSQVGGTCGLKALEMIFEALGVQHNGKKIVVGEQTGVNTNAKDNNSNDLKADKDSLLGRALSMQNVTHVGEMFSFDSVESVAKSFGCTAKKIPFKDDAELKNIVDSMDPKTERLMIAYNCYDQSVPQNQGKQLDPNPAASKGFEHWSVLEGYDKADHAIINEGNAGRSQVSLSDLVSSNQTMKNRKFSWKDFYEPNGVPDQDLTKSMRKGYDETVKSQINESDCNIGGFVIKIIKPLPQPVQQGGVQ